MTWMIRFNGRKSTDDEPGVFALFLMIGVVCLFFCMFLMVGGVFSFWYGLVGLAVVEIVLFIYNKMADNYYDNMGQALYSKLVILGCIVVSPILVWGWLNMFLNKRKGE